MVIDIRCGYMSVHISIYHSIANYNKWQSVRRMNKAFAMWPNFFSLFFIIITENVRIPR